MKPIHRGVGKKTPSVVVFISKRSKKQNERHRKLVQHGDVMECIAERRGKQPPCLNPEAMFTSKRIAPRISRCREADMDKRAGKFFTSPTGLSVDTQLSPGAVFHPFVLDFGTNFIDGFIAQSPHCGDSGIFAPPNSNEGSDGEESQSTNPVWSLHISLNQLQKVQSEGSACDTENCLQPTGWNEWRNILPPGNKLCGEAQDKSMVPIKNAKIQEIGGDDVNDLQELFQQNMHVVNLEADDLYDLRQRFAQQMLVNKSSELACRFT
mmetsp:Transcript_9511/g.18573  ORF Transcript_9511/g.18573 Transcript_9511/m.18573 type:complete len:266 (-) Transcript_9511:491-1288(-)